MDGLLNAAKIYLWVQIAMGAFVFLMFLVIIIVSMRQSR